MRKIQSMTKTPKQAKFFSRDGPGTRFLLILSVIMGVTYLGFRQDMLNPALPILSIILLSNEILDFINFCMYVCTTWSFKNPQSAKTSLASLGNDKSVDIFVCTYNESIEVLEASLVGCSLVNYPHTTYLLDDGRRESMRELAKRMNVQYVIRPDNKHAKAGNVNNALKMSSGEFIVCLDADMIPQPNIVEWALDSMRDPKVGIVQFPQEFYNINAIQFCYAKGTTKEGAWQDQQFFYRTIQAGRNRLKSAIWCGAPALLRRLALEEVGGVATETITEDLHTSLKMAKLGWYTVVRSETAAFGLAPHDLESFIVQRKRWCEGTIRILKTAENPITSKGYTIPQGFIFFSGQYYYFLSFVRLFYALLPLGLFFTKEVPINAPFFTFILLWAPPFFLQKYATELNSNRQCRRSLFDELNFYLLFKYPVGVIQGLGFKIQKFIVTPKRFADPSGRKKTLILLLPLCTLLTFYIFCLSNAIQNIFHLTWPLSNKEYYFLFGASWLLYNSNVMIKSIYRALSRYHTEISYRFPVDISGTLKINDGSNTVKVKDLSLTGASLEIISDSELCSKLNDENMKLSLQSPRSQIPLTFNCKVVWIKNKKLKNGSSRCSLGLVFEEMSEAVRYEFLAWLFVIIPPHYPSRKQPYKMGNAEFKEFEISQKKSV
jgi:cellulose synthase (UDP-forming)